MDQLRNQYLEQINQTKYPYYDISGSYANKIRKVFAVVNPFALEQSGSGERLQVGIFDKYNFFYPENLPNSVKFNAFKNHHFDANTASKNPKSQKSFGMSGPPQDNTTSVIIAGSFPRVCERFLKFYNRCVTINGANKCQNEETEFLSVCPNFALEDYRNAKVFQEKAKFIQRQEYYEAMEISPYNKGRSVAQVDAKKRWIDGTAAHLRPDSMWIDERYADVTQEDIDAAKKRVAARQAAREGLINAAGYAYDHAAGHAADHAHETHAHQHKGKH